MTRKTPIDARARPPRSVASAILAVLAACAQAPGSTAGWSVRDSAGVAITESTGPAWADGEGWRVAPDARVDIGVIDGAPEYQLGRVARALRLPDGRIAVANGLSQELRFYDRDGRHLRSAGRKGSGPGEFREMDGVTLHRDSLLVLDRALGRVTAFDHHGNLLGTTRLDPTGDPIHPLRHYRLGGVVGEAELLLLPRAYPADMTPHPEVKWDSTPNLIYGAGGELRDTIGEFSGMDLFSSPERAGNLYFGRFTASSVHGDTLYITDGGRYEIRLYGPHGALGRIVRVDRDRRPVTTADMDAVKEYYRSRAPAGTSEAELERVLNGKPSAEYKPWISHLLVDASNHLWIGEYRPLWADAGVPSAWSVFDPRGRWLGTVPLPPGLVPHQIGTDFVLGVWMDELGVEHVREYALTRDRATPS